MKTKAAEVEYVFFLQQIKERDYKPLPSLILSRLNNRHGDIPWDIVMTETAPGTWLIAGV